MKGQNVSKPEMAFAKGEFGGSYDKRQTAWQQKPAYKKNDNSFMRRNQI